MITGKKDDEVANGSMLNDATAKAPATEATGGESDPIDRELGVHHLQAGSVRRLLAERENVVAYRMIDRIESIDRELKGLGYKGSVSAPVNGANQAPVGRSSGKPDVTAPVVENTTPPKGTTAT